MVFDTRSLGSVTEVATGTRVDGDALRRRIAARAGVLAAMGVGPGERVVLAHGGTAAFFVDLFAVWRRGAAAVCVNPGLTGGELSRVVAFARAALVVAEPTRDAPAGIPRLGPPDHSEAAADVPESVSMDADDAALILFTSGTTGLPKGVVHTARSLSRRVAENGRRIPAAALARSLCVLPTHFGHGLIGNCLTPLAGGGELILFAGSGVSGAARLGEIVDRHGVAFMSSVPSYWKLALKASRPPERGTLARVHVGSAPLSARLWQDIADWTGAEVCNLYGITETANWAAGASSAEFTPEDGLIGRMWGGEAAVRGRDGRIAHAGEGEILLRTPGLMAGYLDRADLTAAALRDGWYHTGDRGRIGEDGVIRLTGRIKTEINRAGVKVSPEELDLLVEGHPLVIEACCFAVPDPVLGEAVGMAVHLGTPAPEMAELRLWCAARIRAECVPERWFVVAGIPRTDRGKIDRDAVRDACLERAGT